MVIVNNFPKFAELESGWATSYTGLSGRPLRSLLLPPPLAEGMWLGITKGANVVADLPGYKQRVVGLLARRESSGRRLRGMEICES